MFNRLTGSGNAPKRSLQETLICGFATDGAGHQLRTTSPTPGQMSFTLLNFSASRNDHSFTVPVQDADLLDQFYIAHSNTAVADCSADDSKAVHWIIRGANSVAKYTRRGVGNHIICHPDFELQDHAALKASYVFHQRDWMPSNEAFVFYAGGTSADRGGIVFGNGKVVLNQLPTGDKFGYGRRVVFEV